MISLESARLNARFHRNAVKNYERCAREAGTQEQRAYYVTMANIRRDLAKAYNAICRVQFAAKHQRPLPVGGHAVYID